MERGMFGEIYMMIIFDICAVVIIVLLTLLMFGIVTWVMILLFRHIKDEL